MKQETPKFIHPEWTFSQNFHNVERIKKYKIESKANFRCIDLHLKLILRCALSSKVDCMFFSILVVTDPTKKNYDKVEPQEKKVGRAKSHLTRYIFSSK